MGVGHGRHSKRPDHGATPAQVVAELRSALQALREVKKALSRADTRFRQVPPAVLNENQWAWSMPANVEVAAQQAAGLKASIDRALACVPGDGRAPPRPIANDLPPAVSPEMLDAEDEERRAEIKREVDEQLRRQQHRGGKSPKNF